MSLKVIRARAIGRVPKWRPNWEFPSQYRVPECNGSLARGYCPKLRPHCLPRPFLELPRPSFQCLVSLCNVPVGFMCVPTCFSVSLSFLLHVPNVHSMSLFVCVLITTHTHAHTPDSTSDCHIYYLGLGLGLGLRPLVMSSTCPLEENKCPFLSSKMLSCPPGVLQH